MQLKLMILLVIYITKVETKTDLFNRLVFIQSQLTPQDFVNKSKNDTTYTSFVFQLYSDETFKLYLKYKQKIKQISGIFSVDYLFTISNNKYTLVSNNKELQGHAEYQTKFGIEWNYNIKISAENLDIKRIQLHYSYMNWTALIIFSLLSAVTIPLNIKMRQKFTYNLKKRTSFTFLFAIMFKLMTIISCFSINLYHSIINIEWYYAILLIILNYIFLTLPVIQIISFFSSIIQVQSQDVNFITYSKNKRILLISILLVIIPLIIVLSCFLNTSIYIFYVLSLFTIYQFGYSFKKQLYSSGRLFLYDLMLTMILTVCALWIPSVNLTPLSLKQATLFWNYNIFLHVILILSAKRIIKEQYLKQVANQQIQNTESNHSIQFKQIPKIITNQLFS